MVACVDLSVYLHYHLSPKFSAVQKGKRTLCLRSLRESWAAKVAEHADTERELAAVKEERERRALHEQGGRRQ